MADQVVSFRPTPAVAEQIAAFCDRTGLTRSGAALVLIAWGLTHQRELTNSFAREFAERHVQGVAS